MSSNVSTFSFELPLGLLKKGKFCKEIELRPMTGQDRVMMANPKSRQNAGYLISNLLKSCIVSIEGSKSSFEDVDNMVVGDRDYLLLMLRTISLPNGDVIHLNMKCGFCEEPLYIELPVDEIPIIKKSTDDFEIVDDKFFAFSAENDDYDISVKMRLATGKDQEDVSTIVSRNPILANYKLYKRCMLEWCGEKGPFDLIFIQNLPAKYLDWMEVEYRKQMPGPDWNYKIDCVVCGADNTINLANSDFLFPRMES